MVKKNERAPTSLFREKEREIERERDSVKQIREHLHYNQKPKTKSKDEIKKQKQPALLKLQTFAETDVCVWERESPEGIRSRCTTIQFQALIPSFYW